MNILLLCDEYPPGRHGGIGTAVQLLARQYVQLGNDVVVAGFYHWGYGGENNFEDNGVKVFRFRPGLASDFFRKQDSLFVRAASRVLKVSGILQWDIKRSLEKYNTFLENLIKEYRIDVVEMPDYHDYMRFCNTAVHFPVLNIPTIVKLHGSMTYFAGEAGDQVLSYTREMEKAILDRADAIVSVSKYTATQTAKYFQLDRNITVLYNGINLPDVSTDIKKIKGLVVFTGTLVEKKGIYQLVKAWNIVAGKVTGAVLHIYGKGPVKKISRLLSELSRESVIFKGHIDRKELYKNLARAEVAVFPSYAETFGLAVAEAMACGTAVISSTRTSGPEIVKDKETGMLADPDDFERIASLIITLLIDDKLRTELAANGQQYVQENFDINIIAKQNLSFYKTVIDKH